MAQALRRTCREIHQAANAYWNHHLPRRVCRSSVLILSRAESTSSGTSRPARLAVLMCHCKTAKSRSARSASLANTRAPFLVVPSNVAPLDHPPPCCLASCCNTSADIDTEPFMTGQAEPLPLSARSAAAPAPSAGDALEVVDDEDIRSTGICIATRKAYSVTRVLQSAHWLSPLRRHCSGDHGDSAHAERRCTILQDSPHLLRGRNETLHFKWRLLRAREALRCVPQWHSVAPSTAQCVP